MLNIFNHNFVTKLVVNFPAHLPDLVGKLLWVIPAFYSCCSHHFTQNLFQIEDIDFPERLCKCGNL